MTTLSSTTNLRLNFFRSLRGKFIFTFFVLSLIPLITMGGLVYIQVKKALETEVTQKLVAVRDIKANQIERYFGERLGDVKVLSNNPSTVSALRAFFEAVKSDMKRSSKSEAKTLRYYRSLYLNQPELVNADDESTYSAVHAQYHSRFKEYLETYGYYDLFLVEPLHGNILYTMGKENEFGTSLINGLYANTNIGEVFKAATTATSPDFTLLKDFAYYGPSKQAASFVASPIFDDSELVGVLILQVPINQINTIMQERTGLGETGETILISSDDFILRSDSRFSEQSTLLKRKVDTEATRASASGETGVKAIIDYRGVLTIIAHTPLNLPHVRWSLNAKIDEAEAFAATHQTLTLMLIIMGLTAVIVLGMAFLLGNSIVKPMLALTDIARQLAAGNMNQTVELKRTDEIGLMGNAFQQMIIDLRQLIEDIVKVSQGLAAGNLRVTPQAEYKGDFVQIKNAQETALSDLQQVVEDIVQVSEGLAVGNLRVVPKAEYRGDFVQIKNALQTALSDLWQVIEDIVLVSQGLAEGGRHVTPQAEYRGNFVQIKDALEAATANLVEFRANNTMQDWLKTGQTRLNEKLRGEQDVAMLAKNAIDFLTTYLEAQVGLFYRVVRLEQPYLKMMASYAYTKNDKRPSVFSFGEGLVGQVALEKQMLCCAHTPEEYTHVIRSGLSDTIPRHVVIIPFLYEKSVTGVIELGFSETPTTIQQTFLEQVMPILGIAINTAESRTKMQELLQQSQIQTEELQSQQEELRQTNEELQSQSEELQVQQEELRQANDELQERAQELEQQKEAIGEKNLSLEKAQQAVEAKAKELELASKYKSEFLANMSHELRTPLNSLLILSQLLCDNKSGHLTDKEVEYAQTIHSAGSDLLTLINEILDLSKVEAGKIELHLEDMPLASLVETVGQKFRPVANEKKLAFQITVADDLPAVLRTDAQRLQQIINNLLSNAFKFTHQGEIKLLMQRCSLSDEDISIMGLEPNKTIAFSVTDTGIGIPKDKQQVIFEAFQQAEGGTSRRYGGTGLGLSISRQLARLLGGELKLESEEGKGSTFTLYLPQATRSDAQTLRRSEEQESQAIVASQTEEILTVVPATPAEVPADITDDRTTLQPADKSLLIIEDDRKFSGILMELARERGFKCIVAEDGETGLQLVEEYQPNAIFLDVGLPQLDGWLVMERLKDNPKTRHIPVHFISASDLNMDAKRMGAIGYLHKPVSLGELNDGLLKIEQFIAKTLKNLLIVVDNQPRQQQILGLVKGDNIQSALAKTQEEALQQLQQGTTDCIILDVELQQQSGIQLLEQLHQNFSQIPVILYANRELTASEEKILHRCAEKLTIKEVKSLERLLDEATLFLHQVQANLPKEQRQILQIVHNKAALLAHKKVLIVDDDMRNTFALMTVLEDKNMEVVIAENGKQALEVLEKNSDIHLVLMDIMMPEMDGYEAMQKIRAQPRYRQLPIIALTAKAMKDDRAKCLEAGANDYISKPVEAEKLISLMRVWLYR